MKGRIRFIFGIVAILSFVVIVRLYFMQVIHGEQFRTAAERQYISQGSEDYNRGSIYFSDKQGEPIPAAISRSGFTIAINPKLIKDADGTYDKINNIVSIDKAEYGSKVANKKTSYAELIKNVNSESAKRVEELDIYGLTVASDKWRFYPAYSLASQSIGFVGYKGDRLAGRYGLESYYEDILVRSPGAAYNNFFAEFFSNASESLKALPKKEGNLVTTIEPTVQRFLEDEMVKIADKWRADGVGGIVINPKNGEIYALAYLPTFDLNKFKETDVELFNNPLVSNVYEMGSIMKAITIASGLDTGVITASSTYNDNGYLELNTETIYNFDKRGRGRVNMQTVLNQSLNTGATHVAFKVGKERFVNYIRLFGLDTETGIDLPSEGKGLLGELDELRDIEVATVSYGQGIATTPIAMVRAMCALSNGGTLVYPHIVKRIEYTDGTYKKIVHDNGKRVIKPETSAEISRMLTTVVDKSLRNGNMSIPGFSIAAKTGTAQMAIEGRKGYVEGRYLHSFFGFFPSNDPRFLILLFQTNPKNASYASETLTDPFFNITKFLIGYYQVPPDRIHEINKAKHLIDSPASATSTEGVVASSTSST